MSDHASVDKEPSSPGPSSLSTTSVTGPPTLPIDMADAKLPYMATRPRCCAISPSDLASDTLPSEPVHWPEHREECESLAPEAIQLTDVVGTKSQQATAWAGYAATDVIHFSRQTEGLAFDGQLNVLLSGDSDHFLINSEALIHMCYSARMTEDLHAHARSRIANFRDHSCSFSESFLSNESSSRRFTTSQFKQKNIKFTMSISDEQKANFKKAADASAHLERLFGSCDKYEDRQHDLEVYFAHAARSELPNGILAEPLSEWPMEFLDHPIENFVAVNDVYGKLFYYLRDLLVRFQTRCQALDLEIELCCVQPEQLFECLKVNPEDKFDRIEDENPALCLLLGAKFLNDTWTSPCATLLTITRESVGLDGTDKSKKTLGELWELFKPTSTALDQYTLSADDSHVCHFPSAKEVLRRRIGLQIHLHDPKLFGFHLMRQDETKHMASVVETGFLGLECTRKNRITKRWPNRLVHSRSDKPGVEKFNTYVGWVDTKPQRWLEWQLEEPLDEEELDYWSRVCTTVTPEEMRKIMKKAVDEAQQGENTTAADGDETVNLDWIDEESNFEATATAGKKTMEAEQDPKGKNKAKAKAKKKRGKAKK
ncbi:hypothetical protein E4U53_005906 [Claviceps sorghi]|nr:hypothetical protein E4U53_005906 [Claviceps sorghi]